MRRPVKPFVTEYRGAGRRQTAAGGPGLKPDLSGADQEPQSAEPRHPAPRSAAEASEEGYEAALRAADALFSSKPAAAEAPSDAAQQAPGAHPSGGRILRVLDEPPSPEMQRLEEERAPKRRGRKPGSKNRPKPVAPLAAQEALAAPLDASRAAPAAPRAFTESADMEGADMENADLDSAGLPGVRPTPLRVAAVPASGRRPVAGGDRYAWVRTKLKPGEQWKRRLPKIAW